MTPKISSLTGPAIKEAAPLVADVLSNRSITRVAREAWPRARDALNKDSGKPRMSERKRTVQETVWVLARLGRLRSDADTAVIKAAREWARSWEYAMQAGEIEDWHDEDEALFSVIKQLPEGI